MGKMMGAFDSDNDMLDRPDLNKCPDCGCFFAQDDCPLCGKPCPEEMRAGNRKPPKKPSYKYDNGYKTISFVDWYHRWWFIALMAFIQPIIAIVLLITSPHKKAHKIIAVIIAVAYGIVSTFAAPFIWGLIYRTEPPVDTSKTREEYIALCEPVNDEDFYRSPETYKDKYITMSFTVKSSFVDPYAEEYGTYYVCIGHTERGDEIEFIVRDCLQDGVQNFMRPDMIVVYGEGDGNTSVYDASGTLHSGPCINMAYAELIRTMPT